MDEVHFQQHGSRCRMWIPPEIADPVCLHAPTRKSISFFGAVRLHDGKLVMSPPKGMFDAQTCWDFLRKIERLSQPSARQVVVITDNARYHHATLHAAWREQMANHFRLHFLPPYSPELNPIENLWHYLKSHFWSNHAYADYDELEQAAVHAWKQAVLDADLMKTVCNAPYAKGATSS